MKRRATLAVMAFACGVMTNANASAPAARPGNVAKQIAAAIPAELQRADVTPKLYRTVTRHAITDEEYRILGSAYGVSGSGFVTKDLYKVAAVSDGRHRIALVERSCCALQDWTLFRPAVPLGIGARDVDLSAATIGGIGLGSSAAAVLRRFGPTVPASPAGRSTLLRYRHQRNHDCATFYSFVLERDRVKAISVKNAC